MSTFCFFFLLGNLGLGRIKKMSLWEKTIFFPRTKQMSVFSIFFQETKSVFFSKKKLKVISGFQNKVCFCYIQFEELKKEAFQLFFNFDETNTWSLVLKQLKIIKRVYIDGTHCSVEDLSYYNRFHTKSNQNIERINRLKNRHIRKAFGRKKKTEKFSCNKFEYHIYFFCQFTVCFFVQKNMEKCVLSICNQSKNFIH